MFRTGKKILLTALSFLLLNESALANDYYAKSKTAFSIVVGGVILK